MEVEDANSNRKKGGPHASTEELFGVPPRVSALET